MKRFFYDRKYRIPRIWSNQELTKFAPLFHGDIVNVSGWQDHDKEGRCYKDYFTAKSSYSITNYLTEYCGFQNQENEIFLDLTATLPAELHGKFDVVFNHTVLEHIFEVQQAFENLCLMSKDIVLLVVPFLQEMHAEYGDFWRFTPSCLQKMFEKHGLSVLYCSYNTHICASTYIFIIASKKPQAWSEKIPSTLQSDSSINIAARSAWISSPSSNMVGSNAIPNIGHQLLLLSDRIGRSLASLRSPKTGD